MKAAALLAASACSCLAAIGNFHVLGTTATQALIGYTAPDGNACTVQVSQSASLTPLALDVDPGTFANANSDLSRPSTVSSGLSRTVVLGQRTAQYATAGTLLGRTPFFARAAGLYAVLRPDHLSFHRRHGRTSRSRRATFRWAALMAIPGCRTPRIPAISRGRKRVGGLATESFIDPLTGVLLQRLGLRGNNWGYWNKVSFGSAFNQGQYHSLRQRRPLDYRHATS